MKMEFVNTDHRYSTVWEFEDALQKMGKGTRTDFERFFHEGGEARRQENLEKRADELNASVDDMDDLDELEVPLDDDDIPEMELEEIDKELGGDDDLADDLEDEEEVEED